MNQDDSKCMLITKKRIIALFLIALMMSVMVGCGRNDSTEDSTTGAIVEEQQNMTDDSASEANVEEPEEEYVLQEVLVGDVAPEFTASLADGNTFTLSEHVGKVILLNFWATWCGPCVGEMPAFQDLYDEYGDEIEILAVNCMEDEATVNQFITDSGYTFPIAYDVDGEVSFTYPSSGIPYTLVIGEDGIVKNIYVGAADAETQYNLYKSAIDAAMAE